MTSLGGVFRVQMMEGPDHNLCDVSNCMTTSELKKSVFQLETETYFNMEKTVASLIPSMYMCSPNKRRR